MSFVSNPFKFIHFVYFLLLGLKMGLEQGLFNKTKLVLTNKLAKVFSGIFNVLIIVVNCAQFYFISLKVNFGSIRFFMFFAFFLGMFLVLFGIKLLGRIKNLKKSKKRHLTV